MDKVGTSIEELLGYGFTRLLHRVEHRFSGACGRHIRKPASAAEVIRRLGLNAGEKVAHPLQPPLQFLRRSRIGDADMVLRAEAFAGHDHYVRFMQ